MPLGRRPFHSTIVAILAFVVAGCVTKVLEQPTDYDSRAISIQTFSLFNQRQDSRLTQSTWRGDWIFRRDRLQLIDRELRNVKPDIFVAQEVMSKAGSPSESDRNILLAGALSDYDWRESDARKYSDTDEVESMALAVNIPLQIAESEDKTLDESFWTMGDDGYLAAATVLSEREEIALFNVQMPSDTGHKHLWYTFIHDRIKQRLEVEKICKERLIVAGFLPGDQDARRFNDFLKGLELKDAAEGFCQVASRCYTATPLNDLFMVTVGEETPARTDRILVHSSAVVFSSARNFEDTHETRAYMRRFGISKLWPGQRLGWNASIRLPRCPKSEVLP